MFTGLVADLGAVDAVDAATDGVRLTVATPLSADLAHGDSVAINGVCLTATELTPTTFVADVMHETLRRSSLAGVASGDVVNVELPLRAADRLGGHVVSGHVDGLGTLQEAREDGFARILVFEASPDLLRYVVEKGSIAIDGVSLTVVDAGEDSLSVSLIPETLERTTLGRLQVGERVNLEVDVLAKYVEKLLPGTRA